jgi:hypothetical protein
MPAGLICAEERCTRQATARGYCDRHYRRHLYHGDFGGDVLTREDRRDRVCCEPGCDLRVHAHGRCQRHYRYHRRNEPAPPRQERRLCLVPGCLRPVRAHGLCRNHDRRAKAGRPLVSSSNGSSSIAFRNMSADEFRQKLTAAAKQVAKDLGLDEDRRALRYAALHPNGALQVKALQLFRKEEDGRLDRLGVKR